MKAPSREVTRSQGSMSNDSDLGAPTLTHNGQDHILTLDFATALTATLPSVCVLYFIHLFMQREKEQEREFIILALTRPYGQHP